jgi:hypothetical protein
MGDLPRKSSTKPDKQPGSPTKHDVSPTKNEFLVVPSNPISGGDAVPVGVQITAAALATLANVPTKDVSVTQSKIELFWENQAIATFDLPEGIFKDGQDIHVSTRIKVPNKAASGTLKANVSVNVIVQGQPKLLTKSEFARFVIEASDNTAVSVGQLILSLQSTQSAIKNTEVVTVKAVVPKPQAKRVLKAVDGAARDMKAAGAGDPAKLITMTIQKQELLSDEVFLGFNFTPSKPAMLKMSWTYDKDDVSQNLIATACLLG